MIQDYQANHGGTNSQPMLSSILVHCPRRRLSIQPLPEYPHVLAVLSQTLVHLFGKRKGFIVDDHTEVVRREEHSCTNKS